MSKFGIIERVKIGPISYRFMLVDRLISEIDNKLQGHIVYQTCELKVEADSDEQIQAVTILHEVLHGIINNAGIVKHDETVIDALAHGLLDVIQDNPELFRLFFVA